MADYSHLKSLEVTEETEREFTFNEIIVGYNEDKTPRFPTIFFRPMVTSNRSFLTERVRVSNERIENQKPDRKKDKVEQLIERLDEDEEASIILAARCATRWGVAPLDKDGKAHDFSRDECLAFLQACPKRQKESLLSWIQNSYNFIDDDAYRTGGGIVDASALGNS